MTLRLAAVALVALAAYALAGPEPVHSYSFGAPVGFAGHVLEGGEPRTCTTCHSDFALNSGTGSVTITAPSTVAPGATVPITITVDNRTPPAAGSAIRQGFQATVRNHAAPVPADQSQAVGTLTITDADNTGRPPGGDEAYVTHTSTGNSQFSWTFDWTAPADPQTATVYVAGNAANGGDGSSGDYIYTATHAITVTTVDTEPAPDASRLTLSAPWPNPVRGTAALRVTLASSAEVVARVVDGRGREVRALAAGPYAAGAYVLRVPTGGLAPGTYFVVVEADGARRVQPMVVAR